MKHIAKNGEGMKQVLDRALGVEKVEEARVYYDFPGDYHPWSGAMDTWNIIEENDAIDALEQYLDEMYPDGIDETELNDLLWFEPEHIFSALGIKNPYDEDEEEEDEDEEDEEEPIDTEEYKNFYIYTWDDGDGNPYVTICGKDDRFRAGANNVEEAKEMIDSGKLSESKIKEGFGPQNDDHKVIKYHGFCIEKSFYDDDVYPYSVQYCGDDCMFKTLKAAKEFIDDINDVESIEEKKIRENLESLSDKAYEQWVKLKRKLGDEYLAEFLIDQMPKHEAELILDYLSDINDIELNGELY